jgi:hypothetical protein
MQKQNKTQPEVSSSQTEITNQENDIDTIFNIENKNCSF